MDIDMDTTGTTTTATDVVRRYVDAVNAGDIDAIDALAADDLIDHHLPPGIPAGREGVKLWCTMLHDALALQVEIQDLVVQRGEDDDRVAVRARITGTHVGEFAGMAPTGRSFDASFISIERVVEGRLVERWEIPDNATIMAQLTGADG